MILRILLERGETPHLLRQHILCVRLGYQSRSSRKVILNKVLAKVELTIVVDLCGNNV